MESPAAQSLGEPGSWVCSQALCPPPHPAEPSHQLSQVATEREVPGPSLQRAHRPALLMVWGHELRAVGAAVRWRKAEAQASSLPWVPERQAFHPPARRNPHVGADCFLMPHIQNGACGSSPTSSTFLVLSIDALPHTQSPGPQDPTLPLSPAQVFFPSVSWIPLSHLIYFNSSVMTFSADPYCHGDHGWSFS